MFGTLPLFAAERYEFEEPQMGVPVRIILYTDNVEKAAKAAAAAFAEFSRLNVVMSDYDSESELSVLCADGGSPKASRDLFAVLTAAKHYCTISDGAFDITVGPMVRLWRRSKRQKELPKPQYIEAAKQLTGNDLWILDEKCRSVKLLKPGMKLDLGGIAKGYAIDKAFEAICKHGIMSQLVDAGGDLRIGTPPPGEKGWKVLVNNQTELLYDIAVAVSGDQFQFIEIGGKKYAHIVDPKTGLGVTEQRTVCVKAATAMEADALASAVFVLGKEKGELLIKKLPGVSVKVFTK
ncbi:MAG: FAD:protein FMN transferase [Planctomycetaceae bacterium]|nr:FAD:protein FMN transferase [Planctomycetaceae bacterium]